VVARLTQAFRRLLPGLRYEPANRDWEIAEFEHRPHGWQKTRRFVVARRFINPEEAETTLFAMGRYIYRAWVTTLPLTPVGVWHFYDGRAGMEPRIRELREDFALRKIPTDPSPLTPCSWKSFDSPTTWSRPFSGPVSTNLGKASRYQNCATNYSCCPAS
jgi:hypothetical protein